MSFTINGTQAEIADGLTVGSLLKEKNIVIESVAVEYNGGILRRVLFDETQIKNGDNIEVLRFVGGG
jgi:sulfur carrier protein